MGKRDLCLKRGERSPSHKAVNKLGERSTKRFNGALLVHVLTMSESFFLVGILHFMYAGAFDELWHGRLCDKHVLIMDAIIDDIVNGREGLPGGAAFRALGASCWAIRKLYMAFDSLKMVRPDAVADLVKRVTIDMANSFAKVRKRRGPLLPLRRGSFQLHAYNINWEGWEKILLPRLFNLPDGADNNSETPHADAAKARVRDFDALLKSKRTPGLTLVEDDTLRYSRHLELIHKGADAYQRLTTNEAVIEAAKELSMLKGPCLNEEQRNAKAEKIIDRCMETVDGALKLWQFSLEKHPDIAAVVLGEGVLSVLVVAYNQRPAMDHTGGPYTVPYAIWPDDNTEADTIEPGRVSIRGVVDIINSDHKPYTWINALGYHLENWDVGSKEILLIADKDNNTLLGFFVLEAYADELNRRLRESAYNAYNAANAALKAFNDEKFEALVNFG